jgi:predicted CoA-substrate-specific enzyme activase
MPHYFAGIDIGSTMTKVVIMEEKVIASIVGPTGPEHRRLAHQVMREALKKADLPFEAIDYIVATGYGRINVPFADKQITEISCHAKGIAHLFPKAKTVIDIGGQDSKGIKIGENGKPVNFIMNDKCAAGSGRFLDILADALELDIAELGALSLEAIEAVQISNICTVYAEPEVKSKLVEGVPLPDLVAGIHESLANRIFRMVNRLKVEKEIILTGGVAKNIGMVKALSQKLGDEVKVPSNPFFTGALGAALLGKDVVKKAMQKGETPKRQELSLKQVRIL